MKAIILAAGRGSRLSKYTANLPKCMLEFAGKTLIQRQVDTLRSCGVEDISIIRGYQADTIDIEGVKLYTNEIWDKTNMLQTLFSQREEFAGELLVTYGDVLFQENVLQQMIDSKAHIGVAVDMGWEAYWKARLGTAEEDTESLVLDGNRITELGEENPDKEKLHGRYVGLIRFSKEGALEALQLYERLEKEFAGKNWPRDKLFEQAYMTDFLQALIDADKIVEAVKIEHGWLEFDTNQDYELYLKWIQEKKLTQFFNLEN